MQVPVEKLKFVCHDKHDTSTFAAVIQLPPSESTLGYKIFCFHAEKQTVSVYVG